MNWGEFKDPVSHMCLIGSVVTPSFLTQEVAGLNNIFHKKNSVTEFAEFSENI